MIKELRTLIVDEERRPSEQEIWDAYDYAKRKECQVELRWFIPHSGWKARIIRDDMSMEDLNNLITAINTAIYSL